MLLTAILVLLTAGQSYKEDISDFLPLENEQQEAFMEYQNTSSARRIYVIFQSPDNDCQPAVDLFSERLERADTAQTINYLQGDDPEVMQEAMDAIYAQMPYLLTAEDYARIDSMTEASDFIARQLENDKQMLMLPSGGMAALQIRHDPLNLFASVLARQKPTNQANSVMLLIDSPFGASETEHNATLVSMVQQICDSVSLQFPDVSVRLTGGPVIAVGNAQQIKKDSIISITFAVILILFLLWLVFRNVRNLMLIAVTIGWGWLFAMGCLTLVHNDVSIIVIGISSVILGIAVNYPLHLIAHLSHTTDVRTALKEIRIPLVVGNVTTVGAFLALVPLQSVALRDLGLFSAFLLVGTIVFVLVWLPHMVQKGADLSHHCVPHSDLQVREPSDIRHHCVPHSDLQVREPSAIRLLERLGDVQLENKRWIVGMVVILTVVLGYFSFQTSFDADLRNINYMTDEQRQDMKLLEQPSSITPGTPSSSPCSGGELGASPKQGRLEGSSLTQWNEWRTTKGAALCQQLRQKAAAMGFADDSFDDFYKLMTLTPPPSAFSPQTSDITSAIVSSLTDNFNYIGWACGAIVFFFLWFSMGSIELALISFLPMAVSWLWILGIMSLLGIQFNVVNIILATFIFGQGDDYTIFMTEGCQYEYAYRRKMLNSYKQSIIISALIMFIGIGSLIVARHPALRSLAEVTIVGMFTVVFMAWLLPTYCFRWLVYDRNGNERRQPITLCGLLFRNRNSAYQKVSDRYRYRGVGISTAVNRRLHYLRKHPEELQQLSSTPVFVDNGWGETAMIVAMLNPDRSFVAKMKNEERSVIANNAIDGYMTNLKIETLTE